jgi:formylglycine-generating enzyme required for sulfatase activity
MSPIRSIILAVALTAIFIPAQAATTWKKIAFPNSTTTCPTGYVPVPSYVLPDSTFVLGFCVMQFEAQMDTLANGYRAISVAGSTPWSNVTWHQAATACQSASARLITENEWLSIAHQAASVAANWTGGAVGTGVLFSGHNDNAPASALNAPASAAADCYTGTGDAASGVGDSAFAGYANNTINASPTAGQCRKLTLPNGQVIWDFAGNLWEWVGDSLVKASRYHGGATGWMSYSSNDGAVSGTSYSIASNLTTNKRPTNNWNANQGMGRYYDGANVAGAYTTVYEWPDYVGANAYNAPVAAFLRGGGWNSGAGGGVFALSLDAGRSSVKGMNNLNNAGFRCTR